MLMSVGLKVYIVIYLLVREHIITSKNISRFVCPEVALSHLDLFICIASGFEVYMFVYSIFMVFVGGVGVILLTGGVGYYGYK